MTQRTAIWPRRGSLWPRVNGEYGFLRAKPGNAFRGALTRRGPPYRELFTIFLRDTEGRLIEPDASKVHESSERFLRSPAEIDR